MTDILFAGFFLRTKCLCFVDKSVWLLGGDGWAYDIGYGIKGDMRKSQAEAKRAVEAGYWPLYRYNPANDKPFTWETKEATASFQEFIRSERRYSSLLKTAPADAEALYAQAEEDCKRRMNFFKNLGEVL